MHGQPLQRAVECEAVQEALAVDAKSLRQLLGRRVDVALGRRPRRGQLLGGERVAEVEIAVQIEPVALLGRHHGDCPSGIRRRGADGTVRCRRAPGRR